MLYEHTLILQLLRVNNTLKDKNDLNANHRYWIGYSLEFFAILVLLIFPFRFFKVPTS